MLSRNVLVSRRKVAVITSKCPSVLPTDESADRHIVTNLAVHILVGSKPNRFLIRIDSNKSSNDSASVTHRLCKITMDQHLALGGHTPDDLCCDDEGEMRKRLREIADQALQLGGVLFCEKSQGIA